MATGSVSLQNFLYFPPFGMLPAADELDTNYYAENSQGESGDACMLHCSGSACMGQEGAVVPEQTRPTRECEFPIDNPLRLCLTAGMVLPARTWCFVAESVGDAMSQEAVLGHRCVWGDTLGSRPLGRIWG